jgi:PAS domain S-box-containing protein
MPSDSEPPSPTGAAQGTHHPPGEDLFRVLVEAVQDYAIFLLSPKGEVLTWNPGAQRAKGYNADDIIGQHFSIFYTAEERAAGRPAKLLRKAAEDGRVEDEGWRVRKDGTRFWADVILTALRDSSGELTAYAKITRDLTERRVAEEQRQNLLLEQRARSAAEEALGARDRFLSIASHELKTPVATLQLSAESILRARDLGRLDDERLDTGLHRILTSVRRLVALVDELLDVSLLTSGTMGTDREPTDVVALVEEVVARFADADPDAEERRRIRIDAPAAVTIAADASRLDQVFTNLVDNARKYSPDGEAIDVQVIDQPDGVSVSVADHGIGIDAATEARLFEAFSRGGNAKNIPGIGLGLFISAQIVQRHGGKISAEPRPGGVGSVFTVWLPKEGA